MAVTPAHPEIRIALGYAPASARPALGVLFALDERLAGVVARTTEPTIGLIRLAWWREALATLADGPPPGEALLIAARELVRTVIAAADLAALTDGWEALIDDPDFAAETVAIHARARGARLFALTGEILGVPADESGRLALAGEGWARVDLARHARDPALAAAILASARAPLEQAMTARWPRPLRPLGQLAALALEDVGRGVGRWRQPASGPRLLRILRFHATGR